MESSAIISSADFPVLAVSSVVSTVSVSSGSVTSGSVTSGSVTSGSVTSGSVTSGSVTSGSVTSGSVTSGSVTSGSVTSGSVTSGSVTSGSVTSSSVMSGSVTSGTVTSVTAGTFSSVPAGTSAKTVTVHWRAVSAAIDAAAMTFVTRFFIMTILSNGYCTYQQVALSHTAFSIIIHHFFNECNNFGIKRNHNLVKNVTK